MATNPVQLIVAGFADEAKAKETYAQLKAFKKETGAIRILDAAWLWKDASGTLKIREARDAGAGKGFVMGGIVGGAIGVLTGGVGLALVGGTGVIGSLIAKFHDGGFDDERLKLAGSQLPNESSMLIVLVEHTWVGDIENMVKQAGADLATLAVSDAIATELQNGNESLVTVAADEHMLAVGVGSAPSA